MGCRGKYVTSWPQLAMNRFLPLLATQIPTLWIHTSGRGAGSGGSDIRSMSSIRPICKFRCPPLGCSESTKQWMYNPQTINQHGSPSLSFSSDQRCMDHPKSMSFFLSNVGGRGGGVFKKYKHCYLGGEQVYEWLANTVFHCFLFIYWCDSVLEV